MGHRVIVSDVQESFIWVRYKRNENQLIIFADDTHPRWVTTACLLDYDTVAGADKFGNICVVSWAGLEKSPLIVWILAVKSRCHRMCGPQGGAGSLTLWRGQL